MYQTINKRKSKQCITEKQRDREDAVRNIPSDVMQGNFNLKFLNNSQIINESKLCLIRDDEKAQPSTAKWKWRSIEEEGPFARSTPVTLEFSSPHMRQVYMRSQGNIDSFSLKHFRYTVNEIKDNFVEIETRVKQEHIKPCLDIIKDTKSLIRDVLVHSVELMTKTKVKEIIIKVI